MTNSEEIKTRFTYNAPSPEKVTQHEAIREFGRQFASYLDDVVPSSRELSLAQTKIEEAVMWANAAVARRS